jgi:hypothetical protein
VIKIGTRVRSLRDARIVGTVQGYGTLLPCPRDGMAQNFEGRPVVVYLVWDDRSPGSNSLVNPTLHVLDVDHVEEVR